MTSHLHPSLPPPALHRMARAIEAWQALGAVWVDLPWVVAPDAILATRPPHAGQDTITPHGALVASGEQSFGALADQHALPPGSCWIGWTPCWRDEPVFDQWHHFGFIKAELFCWADGWSPRDDQTWRQLAPTQLHIMIDRAQHLFHTWLKESIPHAPLPSVVDLSPVLPVDLINKDIIWEGIELGSYGLRRHPTNGRPYLYGTALAEPRFSQALRSKTCANITPSSGR